MTARMVAMKVVFMVEFGWLYVELGVGYDMLCQVIIEIALCSISLVDL